MKHLFEGDVLVVPADRPKRVDGHVVVDEVQGKLLGGRLFVDTSAHTDPSDLRVEVVAPSGQKAILMSRPVGNGSLASWHEIPRSLLSEGPNGHWNISVYDLVRGDGGRVQWRVELETAAKDFYIEVELSESIRETSAFRKAFEDATARWAEVIVEALTPATLPNGRRVDNILIFGDAVAIDGPGRILGQAAPTHVRFGSKLPIAATMRFDAADMWLMADNGTLPAVIQHEMGHSLGIGTLWEWMGLVADLGTDNPIFTGPFAMAAFVEWLKSRGRDVDSWKGVPIENTGGSGTREAHWRESVFNTELMTGWIDPGFNAMSRITVASLVDSGYDVDMRAADPLQLVLASMVRNISRLQRCACSHIKPVVVEEAA